MLTTRRTTTGRALGLLLAAMLLLVLLAVTAPRALAAYGDEFGAAPINDHPDAIQSAPALAGYQHAFWAGACDIGAAPAFGVPIGGTGFGSRPAQVLAPRNTPANPHTLVPAPATAEHCLDPGMPARYGFQPLIWQAIPYDIEGPVPPINDPAGDYAPSWRLDAFTQAGAHPDGSTMLAFNRNTSGDGLPAGTLPGVTVDGSVDNIIVDLPPGFVGNPNAVPECTAEQFASRPLRCPAESQVGVLRLNIEAGVVGVSAATETAHPLYNLEPRRGNVAEIGFGYATDRKAATVRLVGKARTNSDFGVTAFVGQIPAALVAVNQSATLWGVPWAAHNDLWRDADSSIEPDGVSVCRKDPTTAFPQYLSPSGLPEECQASYDPSWGPIKPFLTSETDCNPAPTVHMWLDSFQNAAAFTVEGDPVASDPNWKRYSATSPATDGCERLDFEPDISFSPTTAAADGPTGLVAELSLPQNNDLPFGPPASGAPQPEVDGYVEAAMDHWRSEEGLATAHLKDTVVELPPGFSVNPSSAPGLRGCGDEQFGVTAQGNPPRFNNSDPFDGDASDGVECPDGSKIGTVQVETELLDEPLTGEAVLGEPKSTDPRSGEMLRMFLVVRLPERGLIAKIYGSAVADPQTGRLTATFENNPELPFDSLRLDLEGGDRGLLAMPQRCGDHGWNAAFTPWSSVGAPVAVPDRLDGGALSATASCGFGFAPRLQAGVSSRQARGTGSLSFRLSRSDGEQWLGGVTAKLPTGLLASVRDVPLCTSAQAASGSCPAESRIGSVDAAAGSGDPFVLERKGDAYLTEGYKGAPYGMLVRVPVEAGPFRGALELSPIVVRQALHVDRRSAAVSVVSDPLPLIHHGIPLRARELVVTVDRDRFVRNPSDCDPKEIGAQITSPEGATATPATRFQASGCAALPFKPRLALRLTGRKQVRTGKHPGVRAQVRQAGIGEAGIENARVVLPGSLALDPENAQALCEFEDGTRDDLENHCPKGSIVGRARAESPLLRRPLTGNVYFVKNVRIDPRTGNRIRTLPMIVVALRGEIAVNLRGVSSTSKAGKLINTFADVPDAPVSSFDLNISGGRNGILAVTRTRKGRISLCDRRQVALTRFAGHNGKRRAPRVAMKTPCGGTKQRAGTRKKRAR